jgi:hypothetical protein
LPQPSSIHPSLPGGHFFGAHFGWHLWSLQMVSLGQGGQVTLPLQPSEMVPQNRV